MGKTEIIEVLGVSFMLFLYLLWWWLFLIWLLLMVAKHLLW